MDSATTIKRTSAEAKLSVAEDLLKRVRADVLIAMRTLDRADTRAAHHRLALVALAVSDALDEVSK